MAIWVNEHITFDQLSSEILAYALAKASSEPALLARLRRETHLKVLYARMISSPLQGRLLAMLSRLARPKRILEVGTFTGFSAICLCEGLQEDGEMITIEKNEELNFIIEPYHQEAGISQQVDVRFGDAKEMIPTVEGTFDLIFLDADKANYTTYYELLIPKLKQGGLLIADNVLWFGKVLNEAYQDKESVGIRAFNDLVSQDERVESLLLPLEDGLMLAWKK